MTRGESQLGSKWMTMQSVLLLAALLAWSPLGFAQSATPVPTGATAAPALPEPPPGSVPTVAKSQSAPTVVVEPTLPGMPAAQGEEVDRVVAIVNGQLILDSDVDRERRIAALLPYGDSSGPYNRDATIDRLINRDLILQQVQLQPGTTVTQEEAGKDLDALRKSIPTCAEHQCETKEGWDKFLATEGFTEESLTSLWRERMEVLAFIEQRFRMGIRVLPAEIDEYYTRTLLPEYAAQHVPAPPQRVLSKRIQEILLQQKVSKLLDDWLASLRAQGNVVIVSAGREAR